MTSTAGVMTPATAGQPQPRCTTRGYPVRYAGGDDRPCLDHSEDPVRDTLQARAAGLGVVMETAPGDHASEAGQ